MSGCLIAVIVAAVLAVPMIGILAALSLPAYQQYVLRSKTSEALAATAALKFQIAQFQAEHRQCPGNDDDGFQPAGEYAAGSVTGITIGRFESGNCGMQVDIGSTGSDQLDGKAIWLEYDGDAWECSSQIDDKYLPLLCRG